MESWTKSHSPEANANNAAPNTRVTLKPQTSQEARRGVLLYKSQRTAKVDQCLTVSLPSHFPLTLFSFTRCLAVSPNNPMQGDTVTTHFALMLNLWATAKDDDSSGFVLWPSQLRGDFFPVFGRFGSNVSLTVHVWRLLEHDCISSCSHVDNIHAKARTHMKKPSGCSCKAPHYRSSPVRIRTEMSAFSSSQEGNIYTVLDQWTKRYSCG